MGLLSYKLNVSLSNEVLPVKCEFKQGFFLSLEYLNDLSIQMIKIFA